MTAIVKEFTKGLWKERPPFRLVLGLCPVLAVTKSAENGLGMGLSISRSIISSQGGEMGFQQNPAGGSTFFFTLPTLTEDLDG